MNKKVGIILARYATSIALCVIFMPNGMSADELAYKYKQEIDHKLLTLDIYKEGGAIGVYKKYLSKRKANYSPSDAKIAAYQILDLVNRSSVSKLTQLPTDNAFYGESDYSSINAYPRTNNYVVPFFQIHRDKISKTVELSTYEYSDENVRKNDINITDLDHARSFGNAYAIRDGFFISEFDRETERLWYLANDEVDLREVNIAPDQFTTEEIYDITQRGERIFVLSVSSSPSSVSHLLLTDFHKNLEEKSHYLLRLDQEKAVNAEFIPGVSSVPSVLLRSFKRSFREATIEIIEINENKNRVVWGKEVENVDALRDISVAGPCNGWYILAENKDYDSSNTREVELIVDFKFVRSNGEMKNIDDQIKLQKSVFGDMHLAVTGNSLLVGINFSRFEDEPRSDGLYSWKGFQISNVNIESTCG